ncbi:hypothetical protein [Agaribacter marinus]|uniref:Membrane protein n=1 Tax=Agaribacter marinus TaxID=1431249 RepID=A0AA37SY32_9ALTE|nr:hypothetical protein [Agaribacter marinus]GLR71997.1 membrane protein [Agaribacter marinus]
MELKHLRFVAKYRSPWQVFDLSQLVVRPCYWALFKIYTVLVFPLAITLYFLLPTEYASIILWWLKPVFERPLLHYLSQYSFGIHPSLSDCLKSLKHLRIKSILLMLTVHRLSPNRAFLAAVDQLERQDGQKAKQRKDVLTARTHTKQTWWTLFCLHIEMLIVSVLFVALYSLIPQGVHIDTEFLYENVNTALVQSLYFLFYVFAISLVAPYFTTGGFLMYLNSRIQLEAWDIELTFKKIVSKFSSLLIVILFSSIVFLPSKQSIAAKDDSTPLANQETTQPLTAADATYTTQLRQIVQDTYEEHAIIEKTIAWEPVTKQSDSDNDLPQWVKDLIALFGNSKEMSSSTSLIIWCLIGLIVAWFIWLLVRKQNIWFKHTAHKSERKPTPQEFPSFFREISQQDWPDDLLAAAHDALNKHEVRLSVAFILKHMLMRADQYLPVKLHKSMTEIECERAVLLAAPEHLHTIFRTVFRTWIRIAWAHKNVEHTQVFDVLEDVKKITWEKSNAIS